MMTAGVILLVALGSGAGSAAGADTLTLSEYRDRLASIQKTLDRGDLEAARSGARELKKAVVRHEGVDLGTDATVLGPVEAARDLPAAHLASLRLRALIEELGATSGGARPKEPDPALLERLRAEEAERRLDPGESAGGPSLHAPRGFLSWLRDALAEFWKYLERFLRWLLRLLFSGGAGGSEPSSTTRWMVAALVVTVVGGLAIVAVLALRRVRRVPGPGEAVSEAPRMSARDEDPLSRTASEWERFAAELMKGGRFREAIRAWYHALLVSIFRAGALHYRKDRTNWEYAYALPSSVPWRAGFVEATRTFEQEWYGRRDTPVETAELYQEKAIRMLGAVRQGGAR